MIVFNDSDISGSSFFNYPTYSDLSTSRQSLIMAGTTAGRFVLESIRRNLSPDDKDYCEKIIVMEIKSTSLFLSLLVTKIETGKPASQYLSTEIHFTLYA